MLADHLTSELRVNVTAKGRSVDEWRLRSPGRDNHWLDCLVGCAVGASMLGVSLQEASAKPVERKRVRFSELQARAHRYTAESWRRRHSGGHVDGESF